jgi:hypothetical protein
MVKRAFHPKNSDIIKFLLDRLNVDPNKEHGQVNHSVFARAFWDSNMDQDDKLRLAFRYQMLDEAEMLLKHERFSAPNLKMVVRFVAALESLVN